MVVWSPLSTENQRIWRLGHPTCSPTRKTDSSDSTVLSAFCTKNGAGWSGDISGDKLGGLTDHLGGLSDSEPGPRRAVGPRKTLRRRSSGTGPGFAHFCTQKASGDEAVTSGDKFSGLEFAGFSGQKTEFGALFGGKRANLEARAPLSTSDTKKRTFRSSPFSALFAPKTEW